MILSVINFACAMFAVPIFLLAGYVVICMGSLFIPERAR